MAHCHSQAHAAAAAAARWRARLLRAVARLATAGSTACAPLATATAWQSAESGIRHTAGSRSPRCQQSCSRLLGRSSGRWSSWRRRGLGCSRSRIPAAATISIVTPTTKPPRKPPTRSLSGSRCTPPSVAMRRARPPPWRCTRRGAWRRGRRIRPSAPPPCSP